MPASAVEFLDIFEHIGLIMLLIDPVSGKITNANSSACAFYGYSKEEIVGMPMQQINVLPISELSCQMKKALGKECNTFHFSHRLASGEVREIVSHAHPVNILGKQELLSIIHDITELKRSERSLAYQAGMLELAHDSIIARDMKARITYWNRGATERYGWTAQEALGKVIHELLQTKSPAGLEAIYTVLMQKGRWEGELTHRTKSGEEIVVASRWQIQNLEGAPSVIFEINNDVTERKRLQHELERQAHTDYLTEVLNRRYFMEVAELELVRSLRYGNQLSILMLDLDFFKRVNDTYGHKMGDVVLKKTTEVCRQVLREIDVIGRFGGEEFVMLLPQTGMEEAITAAERLRLAIEGTRISLESGLPLYVTASIGVTSLAGKDDNLDVLLDQADKALYAAKNAGRNSVKSIPPHF